LDIPASVKVPTRLSLHVPQSVLQAEKQVLRLARFRVFVAVRSSFARLLLAKTFIIEVALAKALSLAVTMAVATFKAISADAPELVRVEIKLFLQAAQFATHAEKQGSRLARFAAVVAVPSPKGVNAFDAACDVAATVFANAASFIAIKVEAMVAAIGPESPALASVFARLLHNAQFIVHLEKHSSSSATLIVVAVLTSVDGARRLVVTVMIEAALFENAACFVAIREVASAMAALGSRPAEVRVEVRLLVHETHDAVHLEKHASKVARVAALVVLEIPMLASAEIAVESMAWTLRAYAFCLEAIKAIATCSAELPERPTFESVSVRLTLQALQRRLHLAKHRSKFAAFAALRTVFTPAIERAEETAGKKL